MPTEARAHTRKMGPALEDSWVRSVRRPVLAKNNGTKKLLTTSSCSINETMKSRSSFGTEIPKQHNQ